MDGLITEFFNVLPDVLCEDIIEKYNQFTTKGNFTIPKNNNTWIRIECNLYKELLVKLNDYKNKILQNITSSESIELVELLNKNMYLNDFIIEKNSSSNKILKYIRRNNRHNVVSFIFFLTELETGGEIVFYNKTIKPKKGNLIIFPDSLNYSYTVNPIDSEMSQYVISGQLSIII